MFRVTFLTDDKRLGRAHRALVGIAIDTPEVTVLVDAEEKGGKVVSSVFNHGRFLRGLPKTFNKEQALEQMEKWKIPPTVSRYAHLMRELIRLKLVKRTKRNTYLNIGAR